MSWLLPLLVARALMPAGFMLAADGDGLRWVLCSGTGPVPMFQSSEQASEPTASAHPHEHAAHHQDGDHSNTSRSAHDNAVCPFAFAASPCATGAAFIAALAPLSAAEQTSTYSDPLLESGPVRVECIRGPPVCA
jgi:hypothetical protein